MISDNNLQPFSGNRRGIFELLSPGHQVGIPGLWWKNTIQA